MCWLTIYALLIFTSVSHLSFMYIKKLGSTGGCRHGRNPATPRKLAFPGTTRMPLLNYKLSSSLYKAIPLQQVSSQKQLSNSKLVKLDPIGELSFRTKFNKATFKRLYTFQVDNFTFKVSNSLKIDHSSSK